MTKAEAELQVEVANAKLVRNKPTAYGRATLGAKPFRRAPFYEKCEHECLGRDAETVVR